MANQDENPVVRAQRLAAEGVAHRERVKNEQVDEYYKRDAENRPTPTQAENDLAKVGNPPQELEPHGAESDEEGVRRVLESRIPANNPYNVRDLSAQEQPRRGPGRPPARKPEGE